MSFDPKGRQKCCLIGSNSVEHQSNGSHTSSESAHAVYSFPYKVKTSQMRLLDPVGRQKCCLTGSIIYLLSAKALWVT